MGVSLVILNSKCQDKHKWLQGAEREVQFRHYEIFFHGKGYKALEYNAQGSGGVTIPGSAQEAIGCGI